MGLLLWLLFKKEIFVYSSTLTECWDCKSKAFKKQNVPEVVHMALFQPPLHFLHSSLLCATLFVSSGPTFHHCIGQDKFWRWTGFFKYFYLVLLSTETIVSVLCSLLLLKLQGMWPRYAHFGNWRNFLGKQNAIPKKLISPTNSFSSSSLKWKKD